MKKSMVSIELGDLLKGIEASILEYAGGDDEYYIYSAVHGLCVKLEIPANEDIESEIDDNLQSKNYDRGFVYGVRTYYSSAMREFEVAVREFFETHDFLRFRSSLNSITFF